MPRKVFNGLDLTDQRIENLGTPTEDTDAATKAYVDTYVDGAVVAAEYTAGAGLELDGTEFAIDAAVVARKYVTTIGNDSDTSIEVAHSLGTRDVTVSVHDATTYEEVYPDVFKTTVNTVDLVFENAPASASLRVTVVG